MMRKLLIISIFTIILNLPVVASNEIVLEGIFQGENVFVMNPFASSGVGFCVYEVTVNGELTTDEINSSAFEIDLSAFPLKEGDNIKIVIKHKEGCTPKILNPEVLKPRSTFNVETIKVEKGGTLMWITTNEKGSLVFIVEQFRWNKWIKVANVQGKGTPSKNTYSCPVDLHSGNNKFRIKQQDFSKKPRYSPDVTYNNLAAKVTFLPGDGKKAAIDIKFSAITSYEVYDYYGKLQLKGKSDKIDITRLPKGQYFINYDNVTETFEKK